MSDLFKTSSAIYTIFIKLYSILNLLNYLTKYTII